MAGPVRTTCPYCGVGCGILAKTTGARSIEIAGDPDHPANKGKLCSKGTHLGETVGLEGRLLFPQINGARASWDSALDAVARGFAETIARHGPESVAFYVSGQLLTEDYYAANKLMKGYIGSANIDTNSRLCMASAVAAHVRAFGEDVVPVTYDDLDAADLILLVGSNTAWCHPVIWQRIEAARAARGTKLVVIDPRQTETAEQADLHIAIKPDGDVALFNAALMALQGRGLLDEEYLAQHVTTPADFWATLGGDAGSAATSHGVDQAAFDELITLMASHPGMITLFSQGANQSVGGTDKGNAIINLHLATGRIGKPGAGPFSITGQPNAMGGREVGGLASMLACHLGFGDDHRAAVQAFWQSPAIAPQPGLKAVDMFRAVHDGRIKAIWIMATNPAVSMPDAGFVREALARCPLVVVSDVIANTDTGKLAHILLPALAWGEKDGTVTNSERRISRQRALFSPPGEARADWRIIADVAVRMGYGEGFAWPDAASLFGEYARMTALARDAGFQLDLTRWADAPYDDLPIKPWGGASPFSHGRFSTADGRARLVVVHATPAKRSDPDFPFTLNTGRYRDQWHTMTRTGLSPRLSQHRREPLVEVHPDDAAAHGLADGGLAAVQTSSGRALYRVSLTDAQRPGELFVPIHWTDQTSAGGRTGLLSDQTVDPHSGQPGFKNNAAAISPVVPGWRAFLITRNAVQLPDLFYWTAARIAGGWLYELAGDGLIDTATLLGEKTGLAQIDVGDPARGMRRIAQVDAEGRLETALYVTRSGTLPPRDWIASQLGNIDLDAATILAARPAGAEQDKGPIVCVCFGIGAKEIVDRARTDNLDSVALVGAATQAGTNCGSCRPAIAQLLKENALALETVS